MEVIDRTSVRSLGGIPWSRRMTWSSVRCRGRARIAASTRAVIGTEREPHPFVVSSAPERSLDRDTRIVGREPSVRSGQRSAATSPSRSPASAPIKSAASLIPLATSIIRANSFSRSRSRRCSAGPCTAWCEIPGAEDRVRGASAEPGRAALVRPRAAFDTLRRHACPRIRAPLTSRPARAPPAHLRHSAHSPRNSPLGPPATRPSV